MKSRSLHILLFNQYYPPDTAATATVAQSLAEALAKQYRVTVLAGRPSYDPTVPHPWYPLRREVQGKVVVERVGATAYPRHRMRRRLTNYLSYLVLAIPRTLTINADVILAMTDPPLVGIAAALVARLCHRPFVYSIQDLHPDMAVASGLVQASPVIALWENLHRWALRQADRVIVLGEDMGERIVEKGVKPGRVVVVRTGAHIPESLPSCDHPVVQEIRSGFNFVILHAGNLGFYGAWDALIKAAILLEGEDVGFVFVGEGAAKPMVRRLASSCEIVRFLPFRPPDEVPYVLAAGDIHVVTIRRGIEGMVVPSKLYPLLAAGRPVLAIAPESSDVARIVTRSGCGVVADPDDPASVVEAIRMLVRDKKKLEQMAERARAIAPEYERKKQLERFVQLIEEIASS